MNTRAITQNKKVVTFGEVMLRLTAPNFQRFSQTNEFIATYGGSEANVAISLVNFGIPTEFVTRLPENAMAQACVNSLQAYGLGTDGIIYGGKRMGLYFLESGAAFRNSNVVYDREGSSFATLRPGMIDWEKILSDAGWFHWSGIAGYTQNRRFWDHNQPQPVSQNQLASARTRRRTEPPALQRGLSLSLF